MKKKAELFFTFLKIPFDYIALVLAGMAAWVLRFEESVQEIRPVIFDLPFNDYIFYVLIIALLWLVFFAWSGLYSFTKRKATDELAKIILACSTGMTAVIIYMFFVRELFDSRFIILSGLIFAIIFVSIERIIIRRLRNWSLSIGWGSHRVVVVGEGKDTEAILETFKNQPDLGYKVVAHLKDYSGDEELLKIDKKYQIDGFPFRCSDIR